jgi:hypothetical protein
MALAYSEIALETCRMCIKKAVVGKSDNVGQGSVRPIVVADLYRSGNATQRSRPQKNDLVHLNTDFEALFDQEKDYCFHNDLIALHKAKKYKNSHWPDSPPSNPAYRSTIVWPIRKIRDHPLSIPDYVNSENEQQELFGFLCVDSKKTNVFVEPEDVQLGAAYADTLFHVLQEDGVHTS